MKEIDVIHPILNYKGLGIVDGSRQEMEQAIKLAYECGKGIYIMKALGGGHLITDIQQAFRYILDFPMLIPLPWVCKGLKRYVPISAFLKAGPYRIICNRPWNPMKENYLYTIGVLVAGNVSTGVPRMR